MATRYTVLIQSASPSNTAKQQESKSKAFKSVHKRSTTETELRQRERERELRRGERKNDKDMIKKKRSEQHHIPQAIAARIDQRMKM